MPEVPCCTWGGWGGGSDGEQGSHFDGEVVGWCWGSEEETGEYSVVGWKAVGEEGIERIGLQLLKASVLHDAGIYGVEVSFFRRDRLRIWTERSEM